MAAAFVDCHAFSGRRVLESNTVVRKRCKAGLINLHLLDSNEVTDFQKIIGNPELFSLDLSLPALRPDEVDF